MTFYKLLLLSLIIAPITAFQCFQLRSSCTGTCLNIKSKMSPVAIFFERSQSTVLKMAQVSEKEAKAGIDKVVKALQKDSIANQELGRLVSVNNVLGYGSPKPGQLAVRFNASFKRSGMGRSSIPLPFGLGQTNESEGRGTMVGQVKASIDIASGRVVDCSVFRDLGYGRTFNLKI